MARLIFNPDSATAQAVTLKEGSNTIGRADDNDVCLAEGGVSGHHCRVTLSQGAVVITDLNSTNGTSLNGTRIAEAAWPAGAVMMLGQTPVRLELAEAPAAMPAAPAPVAAPAAKPIVRLRISGNAAPAAPTAAAPPPEVVEAPAAELPPAAGPSVFHAPPGTRCRSHNQVLARWRCPKCAKFFCDNCVATRATTHGPSHMCRGCGVECLPVETSQVFAVEQGFFARLPGAFIYPFRGMGVPILIVAAIIFAVLGVASRFFGIFAILFIVAVTGYMFVFLQNIIHSTAAEEDQLPPLPDFSGLFGAFFTLLGTVAISFILPVGLGVAKLSGVDVPTSAIIAGVVVSLFYFPMAFLAVSMLDSVAAANPLVVIPSIFQVPLQYLVTVILLCVVAAMKSVGAAVSSGAEDATLSTTEMSTLFISMGIQAVWAFISIYLLTVAMRILGNLYVTQREKLGWL